MPRHHQHAHVNALHPRPHCAGITLLYGNTVLLETQSTLKADPSAVPPMLRAVTYGYTLVFALLVAVVVSGYWAFGAAVQPLVLDSIGAPVWLVVAANVMVVVNSVAGYLVSWSRGQHGAGWVPLGQGEGRGEGYDGEKPGCLGARSEAGPSGRCCACQQLCAAVIPHPPTCPGHEAHPPSPQHAAKSVSAPFPCPYRPLLARSSTAKDHRDSACCHTTTPTPHPCAPPGLHFCPCRPLPTRSSTW